MNIVSIEIHWHVCRGCLGSSWCSWNQRSSGIPWNGWSAWFQRRSRYRWFYWRCGKCSLLRIIFICLSCEKLKTFIDTKNMPHTEPTSSFGCCLTSEFLDTLQGAPGSDGAAGPAGARGAAGNMGLPGMTGPQGEAGREVRITRPSTMPVNSMYNNNLIKIINIHHKHGIVILYRVAPVMMDLLAVLELLDSRYDYWYMQGIKRICIQTVHWSLTCIYTRETVVSPDLVDLLESLVPLVLLDPLVALVDLETVERL